MALRNIITKEDPSLYKTSRVVEKFDARLHTLLDDMKDTLIASGGVGLAAPQVGVLKRVCLVMETNVEEGQEEYVIELINPEIIEAEGEQEGPEGCLSFPEEYGIVRRPAKVKVKAQDRNGNFFEVTGEGLTARCFCHETDHLDGIVFTELAERMLDPGELRAPEEKEETEEA